jgi:hypothetical protein
MDGPCCSLLSYGALLVDESWIRRLARMIAYVVCSGFCDQVQGLLAHGLEHLACRASGDCGQVLELGDGRESSVAAGVLVCGGASSVPGRGIR